MRKPWFISLEKRELLLENEGWLRVFHQTGTLFPNLERVPIGHGLAEVALLQKSGAHQ